MKISNTWFTILFIYLYLSIMNAMKKLLLLTTFTMISLTGTYWFAAKETAPIQEIKLHYCNGTGAVTKSLVVSTKPNQEEKICLEFTNEWAIGTTIGVNFVDGTLTADGDQKKACLPESEKKQFWQYVTGYETQLYVPAWGLVRTYAKLKFPDGYAWASYGCVTYFLPDAKKETVQQDGKMFEIFARVGSFVDAFVDGKIVPQLVTIPVKSDLYSDLWSNPNVMIYRHDDRYYSAKTIVFNTGNIAVDSDVTIGRSARWGLLSAQKTLTWQSILPQQFQYVDTDLPWYVTRLVWGPTTVTVEASYTPLYLGAFNNNKKDETYTLVDHNFHFFFPWILIPLIVLFLLYKYLTRKRRKIVSHTPSRIAITQDKPTPSKSRRVTTSIIPEPKLKAPTPKRRSSAQ